MPTVTSTKTSSEYILSMRLHKRPDFLFTVPEKILPDAGTVVTVAVAPTVDIGRFEDALRDVLREKLIVRAAYGLSLQRVMREPRTLKSSSSVSTTSLRQLCSKIAAAPNMFSERKCAPVAISPQLSIIYETTDRSASTRSTDVRCDNQIHFKTTAIVHSPKPNSSSKRDIERDERVLKVYELNDLDTIAEDASKTRYDDLDEDILNQLWKEAFVDITDKVQNVSNDAAGDEKTNGNAIGDRRKSSDVNRTDSKNKINGLHAVPETNSDSIINDTPMCYVSTRTKKRRGDIEEKPDLAANGVNVHAIEEFFSQHIRERENGEVVISPSVARRMNKSSSSSGISESFVGIQELLQINDSTYVNAEEVLKVPTVFENIAVITNEMDKHMDKANKNGTDKHVEKYKDDERNPPSRKAITRNTKIDKSKFDTTLVFNSDDIKKTGSTQAEKGEITAKVKKRSKKATIITPLQVNQKISTEDKTVTVGPNKDMKEKSIPSRIQCQKEDTSKGLRKRRTLYYPNLDQIAEQQHDDCDSQNKNINKSNALSKSPGKICSSVLEEIKKEKPRREIRTTRPRRQKSSKAIAIDSSPRTKKMNDMFETVKNSADLNTVRMNTAKLSSCSANDMAVYNFTSDSEENFVTNTSAKSVLPKSNKVLVDKKTRPRSKRRLFTDDTKKTKGRKSRLSKKDNTKTKGKSNNRRSKKSLIDERMRDAATGDLVPTNTSIIFANNIDSEIAEEVLPLKINTPPAIEPIPASVEKSKRNDESNMKKRKKGDQVQDIAEVARKEENNAKNGKVVSVEERREKETSPLPGLVIEAVPSHENVKDSTISSNVFTRIKQFYQNPNDMRENITDTTANITDVEHLDNEIPPEPVAIDVAISKKTVSESAHIETAEDIVVICSDEGVKSEKTIDTLKTSSPIDGHGDSKESPPDPRIFKKPETPRDKETEDLNSEMKKYYSEFYDKLNALYEKDSSVVSKNSFQQLDYELLNPKVVIEKLPINEESMEGIKNRKMQIKDTGTLPVNENKYPELEKEEVNLCYWKKTTCNEAKESQLLPLRKTMPTRLDADLATDGALEMTNLENSYRDTSTALKTSSPKRTNNNLMFDIRRLEVRISPIKNVDFGNPDSAETLVSDVSSEKGKFLRKNVSSKRNVSYRELMNVSRKERQSKLPISGEESIFKKSFHLRSTSATSENSEEDDKDTHRKDNKFVKNLFNRSKDDKTESTSENRQQTLCNNSEEVEEPTPELIFENAFNSLFGKLEERNTKVTAFKKDSHYVFGKLEKPDTTDATISTDRANISNTPNRTAATNLPSRKNRYNYNISQRELRDLTNGIELKNETRNSKTIPCQKYYLRSSDSHSCRSVNKETPGGNTVKLEELRKRTSINQLNLVSSKKRKLAREGQQPESEIGSVAMGTSSSVVHWLEDAMRSTTSDRESIIQKSDENISHILERLDTTLKEINRETSIGYLKASADVLNGLTEMRKQMLGVVKEMIESDVVFGRRRRRTSLTQIVSRISATTLELVKPVINSGKRWTFIKKGQSKWDNRSSDLMADFKKRVDDIITKDAEKKNRMMVVLKQDLLATKAFLSSAWVRSRLTFC
ncbi:hypothetical protein EVAR_78217_1 [Eumeta japonica]|uniref:Uncharacterized protein n=1 Tax=Eumeta variegata TaxID=151549 RepID=A0A4C1T5G4_EUMVA|nr:hypothetical protein EVAR_78217_1 [Eumeta japonica]